MALLLTNIREGVRDYYTNESFTDDQLDRYIAAAVRIYSNYNPDEVEAIITTVTDQQDYALPTDVLLIKDVEWYPGGTEVVTAPALMEVPLVTPRKWHIATKLAEKIDDSVTAREATGKWEYVQVAGAKTLRLWDTPTAIDDITYFYWRVHPLNVGGAGYNYIPGEDLSIVVYLALAEILRSKLVDVTTEFDYSEGMQRVTKHFVPDNARATIQLLQDSVKSKYAPILGAMS